MRIGMVGCGYVADFYVRTLSAYPHLELAGVMDRDPERARRFGAYHRIPVFETLEALLAEPGIELVLNLTNPHGHYEVSKSILEAGKHVYTEKPVAMVFEESQALVRLAEARGLYIAAAPCSVLGETAQTVWKALREGVVGKVRLVYAELDDGCIPRLPYRQWISESGSPWPYKDEFETGCTIEHAGYYVTWLTAFFGPAATVTAFASCLMPDKGTERPLEVVAPDFSVACIEFVSGVVARLTCSIYPPSNRSFKVIGDEGIIIVPNGWDNGASVRIKRFMNSDRRLRLLASKIISRYFRQNYQLVREPLPAHYFKNSHKMDYARGVAELADAISEKRPCRISARYALHVNEIVLAIQYPSLMGTPRRLTTTFEPIEPMPWAMA